MTNLPDACGGGSLKVRISSDPANAAAVREAVGTAARAQSFSEQDVAAITLAIDEAVCNVIKHGYEGCRGKPIEISIEAVNRSGREGLQFTILDEGRQVNPSSIVGRDLEDLRPGGLGTHIIRSVMDEVEYTPRQPVGMKLRLLKWRPAAGGDSVPAAKPG